MCASPGKPLVLDVQPRTIAAQPAACWHRASVPAPSGRGDRAATVAPFHHRIPAPISGEAATLGVSAAGSDMLYLKADCVLDAPGNGP